MGSRSSSSLLFLRPILSCLYCLFPQNNSYHATPNEYYQQYSVTGLVHKKMITMFCDDKSSLGRTSCSFRLAAWPTPSTSSVPPHLLPDRLCSPGPALDQPWTIFSFQISQFCILMCVRILLTNIDKRRDQQTYGFQTIPLCIWYVRGILVDKLENRGSSQYLARCPQQPRLHFHFYQVLNLYPSFSNYEN